MKRWVENVVFWPSTRPLWSIQYYSLQACLCLVSYGHSDTIFSLILPGNRSKLWPISAVLNCAATASSHTRYSDAKQPSLFCKLQHFMHNGNWHWYQYHMVLKANSSCTKAMPDECLSMPTNSFICHRNMQTHIQLLLLKLHYSLTSILIQAHFIFVFITCNFTWHAKQDVMCWMISVT